MCGCLATLHRVLVVIPHQQPDVVPREQRFHNLTRMRPIPNRIPGMHDQVTPFFTQRPQHRLQRRKVRVDVGEDANSQAAHL